MSYNRAVPAKKLALVGLVFITLFSLLLYFFAQKKHVLPAASIAAVEKKEFRRPNIILISIDTLRADHLGCYGYSRSTSPFIDELAKAGVLFENAYSHSPKTALSHMSIFTSMYPEEHGVDQWTETGATRLSNSIPTISTLLRKVGYRTAGITGGGHVRAELGFDQGMDSYTHFEYFYQARRSASTLLREFLSTSSRSPFFVFLHTYAVHDPYTPPRGFSNFFIDPNYKGKIISSDADLRRISGNEWEQRARYFWQLVNKKNTQDIRRLKDLYDGAIRYTDDELLKLLGNLKKSGRLKNTLIIFLSDHGEEFLEHEHFQHEQMYQELLHVPLILVFPEKRPNQFVNRRVTETVRLVDVMPTILEIAHASIPAHIRGVSLLRLFKQQKSASRQIYSSWAHLKALRMGDQKLILNQIVSKPELYLLNEDPQEKRNVASTHPDVVRALREQINMLNTESQSFQKQVKAGVRVVPDSETIERLKALGYLDSSKPSQSPPE